MRWVSRCRLVTRDTQSWLEAWKVQSHPLLSRGSKGTGQSRVHGEASTKSPDYMVWSCEIPGYLQELGNCCTCGRLGSSSLSPHVPCPPLSVPPTCACGQTAHKLWATYQWLTSEGGAVLDSESSTCGVWCCLQMDGITTELNDTDSVGVLWGNDPPFIWGTRVAVLST